MQIGVPRVYTWTGYPDIFDSALLRLVAFWGLSQFLRHLRAFRISEDSRYFSKIGADHLGGRDLLS